MTGWIEGMNGGRSNGAVCCVDGVATFGAEGVEGGDGLGNRAVWGRGRVRKGIPHSIRLSTIASSEHSRTSR